MIIDSGVFSDGEVVTTDLCIVGGGVAGLTMAMALRNSGIDVLVLESGRIGFDEQIQSMNDGPLLGLTIDPVIEQRLRMLGGSSNHWSGNCMPLQAIDFEARAGIPYSGWPITRADLDPYYLQAQGLVETPADHLYSSAEYRAEIGFKEIPFDPAKLESHLYAESPPTEFGSTYEADLVAAQNIRVVLNATALEIETNDSASEVTTLRVSGVEGPEFRVQAKRFVLAGGGMEIPRLLLLSNAVQPAGLGNGNDLVGRFFMDHISVRPPMTTLLREGEDAFEHYLYAQPVGDNFLRGIVFGSEALLRREELPNFLFFLFVNPDRAPGKFSLRELRKGVAGARVPENLGMHIGNVLTDLDSLPNALYRDITGRNEDLIERLWFEPWSGIESVPNPDSRIFLIDERDDVFGQRRLAVDWQPHPLDLVTQHRATEVLAEEMGRLGYGRVWSQVMADPDQWHRPLWHGKHHCGTTRMAADPKLGVVDANCRVHGISNLYIAGSSVFPTHGAGTPTLTIVALALRLAEHLKDTSL